MFYVGKIIKIRGNRGEVVYVPSNSKNYRPNPRDTLILKSKKYQKRIVLEKYREIKNELVIKFKGVDSINEALKLVGYSIYSIQESRMADKQDQLENYMVKDKDGRLWGRVVRITDYHMNQILEIEDMEQKEIYFVPFTKEIVVEICYENHIIIIDPPAGLKTLNK